MKNKKHIPIPKVWEVDLVYIWCDSSHPNYISSRKKYAKEYNLNAFWSPTRDHNEILHSIRSVRKNMDWIRNIFVCSPKWHRIENLDEKKYNVLYVDNEEILWEENCPNFNSHSLELFSYKIKWLSEYFMQFNDDFFIWSEVSIEDFYNFEEKKIRYYYENHLFLWKPLSLSTQKLINTQLHEKYYFWPAHIPRMFCKWDLKNIVSDNSWVATYTKKSKFRDTQDLQLIHYYWYYLIYRDKGEFIFISNMIEKRKLLYAFKIVLWKIFSENPISVMYQIYLQVIYKKRLYNQKIFLNSEFYALINIWNDIEKNRKNIKKAIDTKKKFICLNDNYNSQDQTLQKKIKQENYSFFYKELLR